MSDDAKLKAMLQEASEIQAGVERTYSAIYTTFGVILPALFGLFAFLAKTGSGEEQLDQPILATVFIIVFALGSLWSQNAWMELLRYVEYKYVVLYPRLYEVSSQKDRKNFLQWSGRRSLVSWLPILLFNLGALVVLLTTHFAFVSRGAEEYCQVVSLAFILAVLVSSGAVLYEARRVELKIQSTSP